MPHPDDIKILEKITNHHKYKGSANLKYPLICYATTKKMRKEKDNWLTAQAAYVAMQSNIPLNLWPTYVLNPKVDNSPFETEYTESDDKVFFGDKYLEHWNGIWLVICHGSSGYINFFQKKLYASQFYEHYASEVMKNQKYKATVIHACYSGKVETIESKESKYVPVIGSTFIEELQGFCTPNQGKKPIIAASLSTITLCPRDSEAHYGCLAISPAALTKELANKEDLLKKYFKVPPKDIPFMNGKLRIRSGGFKAESLSSDAQEDKKVPYKDEITGIPGYGYQDCLTEKFHKEKTISVCNIFNALRDFEVNNSDNTSKNTNIPTNNDEKKEEKEEKEEELTTNPFGAVDSRKNIHKIEFNQPIPKGCWIYTDPNTVFPKTIWSDHIYRTLLKEDPNRGKIYRLNEKSGL